MSDGKETSVVTGAYGYSGKYIAQRLLDRGVSVKTLTGHPGRPNPFGSRVPAMPFNFEYPEVLCESLRGIETVINTYWIRFERGAMTFDRAIQNVETLIDASRRAGVRRFVQVSITNASTQSPLPYFRGKGRLEAALRESGLAYAIVRPTVIFGLEDILINNIAWAVRRFPILAIPGRGDYKLQPVFVEDLAELIVNAAQAESNLELDAVGPEVFTFNELVGLLAERVGRRPHLVHVPPAAALFCTEMIGRIMGDVMLTADERRGLSANLLISNAPPTAPTRLSDWLSQNSGRVGIRYASELARRG